MSAPKLCALYETWRTSLLMNSAVRYCCLSDLRFFAGAGSLVVYDRCDKHMYLRVSRIAPPSPLSMRPFSLVCHPCQPLLSKSKLRRPLALQDCLLLPACRVLWSACITNMILRICPARRVSSIETHGMAYRSMARAFVESKSTHS